MLSRPFLGHDPNAASGLEEVTRADLSGLTPPPLALISSSGRSS